MDMTIEFIYWKYPLNSNYICAVTIRLLLNVSDLDWKKDPPQHLQQTITIQPSHFQVTHNDLKGICWVPCIRHRTNSYTYTNCHRDIGTSRPFAQNRHNDDDQGIDTGNLEIFFRSQNLTSRFWGKAAIFLGEGAILEYWKGMLKWWNWNTQFSEHTLIFWHQMILKVSFS